MSKIEQALTRIFDRHRIVLWYDVKQELREAFGEVALPEVEKIELKGNQFGVKYRILREGPDRKFLLYHAGPPPPDLENWLLDVELAHGTFRADQMALWLSELGLGFEFADEVQSHADFFQAARRREVLGLLLHADDTARHVRLKMLAVCAGAEPRTDDVLENLLGELAAGKDDKIQLIARCALDDLLWDQLRRAYSYRSDAPGIRDFAIELFKSCYAMGTGDHPRLTADALVFLKRWKDSVRHHEAFEALSAECAGILRIEQDLVEREYRSLAMQDTFELIDRKILSGLARDVAERTISAGVCAQIVRQRRQSHWYALYKHPYEAIEMAALFMEKLKDADLTVRSLDHGIEQYSKTWYILDQLYRKFIFHARASGQRTLLDALMDLVENLYTNNYLLQLGDNWQQVVDASATWAAPPVLRQQAFYERKVAPFLRQNKKIFVIISDAMRYEVGEELLRRVRREDRYDATLEPALTLLPSVTALGMAALLPHKALAIDEDGKVALVDGASAQGAANRKKILEQALPGRATAIQADALLGLNREESRSLVRAHDVVYVYHNRIDATGDKRDLEERVFEAAEEALSELVLVIKKLANANANNFLVTADHGFIYQHRALDDSDFASQAPTGTYITGRNRRYVLGRGLVETASFKRFAAPELGLEGETEMLIPKSINRLRVKGAGSRYVHGGAMLQEVIIPVLQINKKRQSDVTLVEVDILRGSTSVITTGQLTVTFYQSTPAAEKVQPRRLRAGIYTEDGELISDQHELSFDLVAEHPREREMPVQFVLTREADKANGQEVLLRLDERVSDTAHYREYKAARYVLRRSFTSDFDF